MRLLNSDKNVISLAIQRDDELAVLKKLKFMYKKTIDEVECTFWKRDKVDKTFYFKYNDTWYSTSVKDIGDVNTLYTTSHFPKERTKRTFTFICEYCGRQNNVKHPHGSVQRYCNYNCYQEHKRKMKKDRLDRILGKI